MDFKDLLPLIIIQLSFQVAALGHLVYKRKTRNLNPWSWAGIILIAQFFGAFFYFFLGRSED